MWISYEKLGNLTSCQYCGMAWKTLLVLKAMCCWEGTDVVEKLSGDCTTNTGHDGRCVLIGLGSLIAMG